jgi:hypothetical protein
MSILYWIRYEPICLLHFILLLMMFIIILLFILVMPITKGKNLQEILFYKIERIFIQFYYTILILVLIILTLFLPISIVFYPIPNIIAQRITFIQFIIILIFLIVIFIIAIVTLKKSIIKKRMRKIYDNIILKLNADIYQKNQDRLVNFMNNLRLLVASISIIAFILSFWGLGDLFLILSFTGLSSLHAPFFILTAFLKFLISFLLLLGCYLLMVRPLYKIRFWKSVTEG